MRAGRRARRLQEQACNEDREKIFRRGEYFVNTNSRKAYAPKRVSFFCTSKIRGRPYGIRTCGQGIKLWVDIPIQDTTSGAFNPNALIVLRAGPIFRAFVSDARAGAVELPVE